MRSATRLVANESEPLGLVGFYELARWASMTDGIGVLWPPAKTVDVTI